jgi:glutamyl-Q tRNA(Asp) synthetase
VNGSTATGTTVTGKPGRTGAVLPGGAARNPAGAPAAYRGRFAPSPTGLLHQGSLFAALASWLDARAAGGAWLLRMEDLDRPRVVPGAAEAILASLARLGLVPDGQVACQSTRAAAYHEALQGLAERGLAYRCRCSRSDVQGPYAGHCRDLGITDPDSAWRLRLDAFPTLAFEDRIQGPMSWQAAELGDPVLFRRDGIAAYQLAVVVDDAWQGITDVVRGADLLESTGWQLAIGAALGLARPRYAHVPLLTEAGGAKLAKSRRSLPLDALQPVPLLLQTLGLLGLPMATVPRNAPASDILMWAVQHWMPGRLAGIRTLPLPG